MTDLPQSCDDFLADVRQSAGVPDAAIVTNAMVAIEYVELEGDQPQYKRLAIGVNDTMTVWEQAGICAFIERTIEQAIVQGDD